MRRFIFSLISFLGCFASHAQDTIVKLSGERFIGRVIANRPNLIEFNYPNETSLNTVPKPLISYVSYSSGRREDISEIVNISGEGGWKNVLVTTNPDEVLGLVRLGEVRAKSNSLVNLNSVVGVDKRASENIQKGAVALGAHIILMLQNETKGETGISLAQSFKSGIAYGYPFETTDTKLPFNGGLARRYYNAQKPPLEISNIKEVIGAKVLFEYEGVVHEGQTLKRVGNFYKIRFTNKKGKQETMPIHISKIEFSDN